MNNDTPKNAASDLPCVACEELGLTYSSGFLGRRRVRALDSVSFSLPSATLTALVGANGSGKSSLLRCLVGHEDKLAGRIEVLGSPPGARALRGRIGAVLGTKLPLAKLSGREYLVLAGAVRGLARRDAQTRADEVLESVALGFAADRAHGAYSTGMARRLALAEAILCEPDLLLLDEPGAGLDPIALAVLRRILQEHRAQGRSAVVATHVLDALGPDVFDRILVLDDGELVHDGTAQEVLGKTELREFAWEKMSDDAEARVLAAAREAGAELRRSGVAQARLSEVIAPDPHDTETEAGRR